MVVREVVPDKYDELHQKLERELPLSIFVGIGPLPVNEEKAPLKKKMVLVDSWPDVSVLLIVDRQRSETWLVFVCFCKGPGFAPNLEIILEFVSREISPPQYIVGCTSDVMDALISAHQSASSRPFRRKYADAIVYTMPAENIVPLPIPDGFHISELSDIHTEIVHKSWPFTCNEKWIQYLITNFQSVLIETDDGRPVAWKFQQEYGAVGMLLVNPEYRRRKLGSIVTRTLAEKMTKDRQLVFALVEENNDISIAFHEKNGYVRMPFKVSSMEYFQEAKENIVNVKP